MRGLYPDSIATMRTGRRVSRDHGETASMQRVVKHLSVGRPTGMQFFSLLLLLLLFFPFLISSFFSSPPNCTRALLVCVDTAHISHDNTRRIDSCTSRLRPVLSSGSLGRSIVTDIRPNRGTSDCIFFLLSRGYRV